MNRIAVFAALCVFSGFYPGGSPSLYAGGAGTPGNISGTWTGSYTMTSDFSESCNNIGRLTYGGTVTMIISEDVLGDFLGNLTGTVSMSDMDVVSINHSSGSCIRKTISPSALIVGGGGFISGATFRVNTNFGESFGNNYWGTNKLLFFTGTLHGGEINGTIAGADEGINGSIGTFTVRRR